MPRREVVFSDLSDQMVPEGKEVTITVRQHPTFTDVVQVLAGEDEIKELLADDSQYVVLDIATKEDVKQVVVDLPTFNGLFKGDAYAILKDAPRVSTASSSSIGPKRSKEELDKIRMWARANGHEVAEKGRIKQDIVDAYEAAQSV